MIDGGAHINVSVYVCLRLRLRLLDKAVRVVDANRLLTRGAWRDRYDGAAGLFGHQYSKPEGICIELQTLSAPASMEGIAMSHRLIHSEVH